MNYSEITKILEYDKSKKSILLQMKTRLDWQSLTFDQQQKKRKEYAEYVKELDKKSVTQNAEYTNKFEKSSNLNISFCQSLNKHSHLYQSHIGFKQFRDIFYYFTNFTSTLLYREGVFDHLNGLLSAADKEGYFKEELKSVNDNFRNHYNSSNVFNLPKLSKQVSKASLILNRKLLNHIKIEEDMIINQINQFGYKPLTIENSSPEHLTIHFQQTWGNLTLLKIFFVEIEGFQLSITDIGRKISSV